MSLFDSLNTFAKNVGDKANEALEVNRLNGKINTEKTQIQQELKKNRRILLQEAYRRTGI